MAESKRACLADDTADTVVIDVVDITYTESDSASYVRRNCARVPRAWIDGITTKTPTVSAYARNDFGKIYEDADNGGDEPERRLAKHFMEIDKDNLDQHPLWPDAEDRLARSHEFRRSHVFRVQPSGDKARDTRDRKEAARAEVAKCRADGTLRKVMHDCDDNIVSAFFAPKGCTPCTAAADMTLVFVCTV